MIFYADGFMLSANGKCHRGGFSVVDEHNVLRARRVFTKHPWTNNDGEMWAVAAAIELAGYQDFILSDSEVVVKWWLPRGQCKARPDLTPLAAHALAQWHYKDLTVGWCPRAQSLAGIYNETHRADLQHNLWNISKSTA